MWEHTRKLTVVSTKIIEEMEGRIMKAREMPSEGTYGMNVEMRHKIEALRDIKRINEVSLTLVNLWFEENLKLLT